MSDTPRTYVVVGDNNLVLTEDVARYQDVSELKQYVRHDDHLRLITSEREAREKAEQELTEIKRQAGDATEFVLAQINADLRGELAAENARLLNYTRLSESGESLGGELEERERRLEVERQLAVAREHVRHLLVLARRAGIVNTETKVADKWLQEQDK